MSLTDSRHSLLDLIKTELYPVSLIAASYLSISGYRKGSLSLDGAITAFVVGYITLANPFPGFGILLITFYLAGSRATKFKAHIKETLETTSASASRDGTPNQTKTKPIATTKKDVSSGNRSSIQVICNSFVSTIAAFLFRLQNSRNSADVIDPLSPKPAGSNATFSNLFLTLLILSHFCACMGDTLSSELGILSESQPTLITQPWRKVPPGTNGGVTAFGFLVAAVGGAALSFVFSFTLLLFSPISSSSSFFTHPVILILGTSAALLGTTLDSVLGATCQQTLQHKKSGKILIGTTTNISNKDDKKSDDNEWIVVSGNNILSNNSVNLVSSTLTALIIAKIGCSVL